MPYGFILLGLVATLAGAPEQAASTPGGTSSAPASPPKSQAQLMAEYYPDRAQRMEKSGDAAVRCTITASGGLTDCAVVSESPTGYDFGAATLRVARRMQVGAPFQEGKTITIPIAWRIGPSQSTPPASGN